MSDSIPLEIQVEVIRRLPLRSVLQFRSVSKAWKSLIDSSPFIARYSGKQHLLVSYVDYKGDFKEKYTSIVDDYTFPKQRVVSVTLPLLVKTLINSIVIGSSDGLLCLYAREGPFSGTGKAVIWNPSIRKAVAVHVPNIGREPYITVLGFGICRETTDPKILKITYIRRGKDVGSVACIFPQVEVFTLSSTGAWRSRYSNVLSKSIQFGQYDKVVIDGVLYWLAVDWITNMNGGFSSYSLIISFDMTSEEFRQVELPDSLALQDIPSLHIYKMRESLGVLEFAFEANIVGHVWMMEDGVSKSFTKLFTINRYTPVGSAIYLKGFRKTGEPVIEVVRDRWRSSLAVYEPYSKSISSVGITGELLCVYPYMETLLLLNHPDYTI